MEARPRDNIIKCEKLKRFTQFNTFFGQKSGIQFDIVKFDKKSQNDECRVSKVGPSQWWIQDFL